MALLSRKKKSPGPTAPPNAYSDAQHVWIERYGSYIQQAYNWRLLAMLEAVALIAAVIGLIYVAAQTKFVPYVVAIDKVGAAFAVYPADRASAVDERVVRATLGEFVTYARTVSPDRALEKSSIEHAYGFIQGGSEAYGYISDYYPKNDPFQRAQTENVQVHIRNVIPISGTSYLIQWGEEVRNKIGYLKNKDKPEESWEARVTVAFAPSADEASMLRNPIGLYITALVWEKVQQ